MAEKYQSVNGAWPVETNDGRDLKPTPQEALTGAKRLFRIAMGRAFRGKWKLTSGRRYTYGRNNVFYVNPDQRTFHGGGGWHEIVHGISHYASARLYPNAGGHGPQHAFIERELIKAVVENGWLEGKLRKPERVKAATDPKREKVTRILSRIEQWQAKERRAKNALRKLERQRKYYERQLAA